MVPFSNGIIFYYTVTNTILYMQIQRIDIADNACLSLPDVGWGGRGARLPKVPVPLPTSNPRKTQTLVNGPFSRSLEEVEEDLFLERVVTMGRGSRRLPTPGGTIR